MDRDTPSVYIREGSKNMVKVMRGVRYPAGECCCEYLRGLM